MTHPNLETVKKSWWWTESPESFSRFAENPFAQGYEIWKRIREFRKELFFLQVMGNAFYSTASPPSWIEVSTQVQQHFALLYRPQLKRLGLIKSIFYSSEMMIFDCTFPAYYLIEALRSEMRNPTSVASGFADGVAFEIKTKIRPTPPSPNPSKHYTKQPRWIPVDASPSDADAPWASPSKYNGRLIGLRLPKKVDWHTGKERPFTEPELLSYFRTFIKDLPKPQFVAHRQKFPRSSAPPAPVRPHVLALGFMAIDFQKLKSLAEWLVSSGTAKMLKVPASSAYTMLANSKRKVRGLITAASRV